MLRQVLHRASLLRGSISTESDFAATYLLACYRYIELNPVRANMVADPGQYRWSSYRTNGLGLPDAKLTPHPLHLAQSSSTEQRTQAHRALFRPHLGAEAALDIRQALQLGMPVSGDRFSELLCAATGIRFNSGKREQEN